ncbi:MAG: hypothetical protein FJ077_08240 [Cyanobacteria bacterium K_DeepCast_35m_m2_023]|nr:hypothetical protein [Cyanobacteria bacterium K_DeepCast_35m_m2_023]
MGFLVPLLKQRHRYYRSLLVVEVLALLCLSSLQRAPQLMGLLYLLITGVVVVFDSPLLASHRLQTKGLLDRLQGLHRSRIQRVLWRRRVIVWGWLTCVGMEVIWQIALLLNPPLAVKLSTPHLVVWLALILQMLWSLVNALAEEPAFNGPVLMGAAAGYLLVGFAGGIALNSLLVLDPPAFNLPGPVHGLPAGIAHAPAMLGASFGSLTTLGSPLLKLDHLSALIPATAITVVGQLYIAILIGGVLSKPRQLSAARQTASKQRLSSSGERQRQRQPS